MTFIQGYVDIVRLYLKKGIHHRCAEESQKQTPAKKGPIKSLKIHNQNINQNMMNNNFNNQQ